MNPKAEIDARRLLCPMPVIRLQNGLTTMAGGDRVKIICTDPGVMADIPTWCRINGHIVVESMEVDDEYIFIVEKSTSS